MNKGEPLRTRPSHSSDTMAPTPQGDICNGKVRKINNRIFCARVCVPVKAP